MKVLYAWDPAGIDIERGKWKINRRLLPFPSESEHGFLSRSVKDW